MQQGPLKLLPYEWSIVSLFSGGILALSFYTWMHAATESSLAQEGVPLGSHWLLVKIEGAIECPGTYRVKRGALLKEVIEMARPKAEANLSKLPLEAPLTQKKRFVVPFTKKKL